MMRFVVYPHVTGCLSLWVLQGAGVNKAAIRQPLPAETPPTHLDFVNR